MLTLNFQVQDDGALTVAARKLCANAIAAHAGQWIKISIAERKEKRTLSQNDYYHGVIIPHVRLFRFDQGDPVSPEAVHEDLLAQFAPYVEAKRMDGTIYQRPKRSKEMSVDEMANYITAIQATMASFGAPVPMENA